MRKPNFEGLAPDAKRALFVARHQAFLDGSAEIEGRHVLIGLLVVEGCLPPDVLAGRQISVEEVRSAIGRG
ncbi:MAG TPA: hypothetical protein VF139_12660 [Candidatus Polarisedimenticolaceae bacterium]